MSMELELAFTPKVSYVMYQNAMEVLLAAKAVNDSDPRKGVEFRISSDPCFFEDVVCRIDEIQPQSEVDLLEQRFPEISLDTGFIFALTERLVSRVTMTAFDQQGIVLASVSQDVEVLPYDYWPGYTMPEMLPSFVTPNAQSLALVRSRASEILGEWKVSSSLEGYQSEDRDRVLTLGAAVFAAIERENITYVNPPAGFEAQGQRIRLPDEVMANHEGTCIDLSAFYAAALESIGLNTMVFLVDGHAFAGFWLVDDYSPDVLNWDSAMYTRMIRNKEIRAVECTAFTNAAGMSFEKACEKALMKLEDAESFICAIDIRKSRTVIQPLPVRRKVGDQWVVERPVARETTSAPASLGAVYTDLEGRPMTKVDRWKRELLDITNKNNMINMKQGTKVIPLLVKDIAFLEDMMADGSEYTLYPKPQEWEGTQIYSAKPFEAENYIGNFEKAFSEEIQRGRIRTPLTDLETERSLRSIYRLASKEMEESGCNCLFLALGVLRWYEGKSTGVPRYAPLILMPVEMKKKQKSFGIKKLDEETVFNVTLAEKLRQEYEIELPNMDPLPLDDSGVNVEQILQTVRQRIGGKEGWEVLQGASLGVFSFSQFAMWKDLDNNIEAYSQSPIVKSLVDSVPYPGEKRLDYDADPYGLCLTVAADSSQIKAVRAAGEGRTFVMHGPPGTGKSQTITNIISNALYQGKTVLFVAEKRAALEVVQKRLVEVGIGNRCLELHSNKTEKTKVIDQLRSSLEPCAPLDESKAKDLLIKIENYRSKLDEYVRELHKERDFGLSAYEAISRYEMHDVPGVRDLRLDHPEVVLTENLVMDIEEDIRNAHQAFYLLGDADTSALEHVALSTVTASMESDAFDLIDEVRRKAAEYQLRLDDLERCGLPIDVRDEDQRDAFFEEILSIPADIARDLNVASMEPEIRALCDSVTALTTQLSMFCSMGFDIPANQLNSAMSMVRDAEGRASVLRDKGQLSPSSVLFDMTRDCREFCNVFTRSASDLVTISASWNAGVFRFERTYKLAESWSSASKAGLLAKGKAKKAFMDAVAPYLRNPTTRFEDLAGTVNLVSQVGPELLRVEGIPVEYADSVAVKTEVNNLRARGRTAERVCRMMSSYNIPPGGFPQVYDSAQRAQGLVGPLQKASDDWAKARWRLADYLMVDLDLSSPEACLSFCDELEPQLPSLFDWANWNSYAGRLRSYGLASVVSAIREGEPDIDLLVHSALRSVYRYFITVCRQDSVALRMFSSATFETQVKQFKNLDQTYTTLNKNALKYKLWLNVPTNMDKAVPGTESAILYKAINSAKIRKSIRKLLSEIPNMLPRLCPCLLMSPQSVSQYITTDFPMFDLVIFDESSQITTSKAIGPLGRARNAVIAGDSKQLPPTSFFQKKVEVSEEDDDMMDVDSFLDDCLALNMPETYLEWHYRSRHESLIAFSNRMFYDGRMMTFPSPNDLETKVSMRLVNGVYERGKRINPIEAKAVVDEVYRRVMDDRLCDQSIGIVAFSISQQTCIQDMLDDLIKADSAFFTRLNMMGEEIFIKNLETVQGDERDVIMFSIGYGPDASGTVYQNFGPINREGGGRRLNVAVSRSKLEMIVFTSMKYSDVKLTSTSSKGVRSLREFLRFAENNGRFPDSAMDVRTSEGTQILADIASTLRENGYDTHFNVGTSQFKVDIGVINPDRPSDYLLGILSDGESYRASENTRDREYARADVLRRLNWNLMHVWSVDWFFNKQRTLNAILERLRTLREKTVPTIELELEVDPHFGLKDKNLEQQKFETEEEPARKGNRLPYVPAEIVPEDVDVDTAVMNTVVIGRHVDPIIEAESPINETYLVKLYCKKVGIKRLTEQKRNMLIPRLRALYDPEIDGEDITYWQDGTDRNITTYRVSDDSELNRPIDCIPKIELINALEDTVRASGSLMRENAISAVARALGFTRTGAKINETIGKVLEAEIASGRVRESNGRLTLSE